jgi:haloalkane dehalogenase
LLEHVPGTKGQPHDRLAGGHFIQEDVGAEIAQRTVDWVRSA